MLKAIFIFLLAGVAEIGGGYLIWQWLCEEASGWLGFFGGVFIVMSLFWGWWIDKKTPDTYDWIGGLICIVGVGVMLLPRN